MAHVIFPKSLRFASLKLLSHGLTSREIEAAIGVGYVSVHRWGKKTGIARKSYLSDEEIEERMEIMAEEMRSLSDDETDPRVKHARDYLNRRKFGNTPEKMADAALAFQDLGGDMEETIGDIRKHFSRVAEQMEQATSPEEQIQKVEGLILLRQLLMVLRSPPPVTTMSDMEKLHKMLRENFNMDDKKGDEEGADLRILTARIQKNKVIDVEDIPPPPPKRAKKKTRKKRK